MPRYKKMSEYQEMKSILAPVLEKAGLKQSEENIQPDVFGSAYSEYFGKGLAYRIVWDGKDGFGYIKSRKENEWLDLKLSTLVGNHNAFGAAITKMRIVLAEHIALAKLLA